MAERSNVDSRSSIWVSPLDQEQRLLYADMKELAGHTLAWCFATEAEERELIKTRTVISDISYMGKTRIAGEAADPFLFGMYDCDFDVLGNIGAGVMATLSNDVAAEIPGNDKPVQTEIIRSGEHEFMLLTRFDQAASLYSLLEEYAECGVEDKLEEGQILLSDETDSFAGICIAGPQADYVLAEMGKASDELAEEKLKALPDFTLGMMRLDTAPTLIFHISLECYYLFVPPTYARGLWRGLLSFHEVSPIGRHAFEVLDIFNR